MAIVNKFNVNKQVVKFDPDIIENMSANDVSYNSSLQYDENTVGDKLSELENKMGDLLDGIHTNLLEGVEWEVGRILYNLEINTTDYHNYRVFKFQCSAGDKLKVVPSYTPTPAFLGYIKEDNKVEVVVNGTGGAIEETTIDCVNATYVICQVVNAIKYITKLEKLSKSTIQSLEDRVSDVENNLEQKIDEAPVNGKQYVRKTQDGKKLK